MAPPPSTAVPPFVCLIVRIITLVCLLIALIILVTANGTASLGDYTDDVKVRFKDFKAFRYLCAAIVLGLGYTFVQTAITVFQATTGNRLGGDTSLYIDFYGDKILSYVLATGAAASFGMTQDFKNLLDLKELGIHKFINTTNAAASLCLIGFVFAAVSSIFSSLSLPKRA